MFIHLEWFNSKLDFLFRYWNAFLCSAWYCRYQIDLLTTKSITLGDILHHETALSYFMQVSRLFIMWNQKLKITLYYCNYKVETYFSIDGLFKFLEIEGCQNVVEFWLAASNFQQFVQNTPKTDNTYLSQIVDDAISIYEK